ncbi:hypothetical protein [Cytobacillus praedii]|uniref:hypothetical protein n=1 Tax=Cytobacillus praedii TaxID=1742358 RepID=UPI002E1FD22A|nr:hypothetical protein [Cytobacillus praedii]
MNNLRFLFAIPFIIGAFLIGLTSHVIGEIGNIVIDIIGWGLMFVSIIIIGGRKKKEKIISSNTINMYDLIINNVNMDVNRKNRRNDRQQKV